MSRIGRITAILLLVAMAVTVLGSGADARKKRRGHDKSKRTSERQSTPDNLGVSIQFRDNEPVIPLGGGLLFDDDPDQFMGNISNFKKSCSGIIEVDVFRGSGLMLGSAKVSDGGAWALNYEDPGDGAYYAVARRFATNHGANRICAQGTSDTADVTDTTGDITDPLSP